jgi:ATP-dependent Clp protease ATP-binding subunit ClpA
VVKFIDELKTSLTGKNITINLAESVVEYLAEVGYDSKMGARPLSRKIDELVRVPLSRKILFEGLHDCNVRCIMTDGAIQFIVEDPARAEAKIDEKGYIVLEQFKPRT